MIVNPYNFFLQFIRNGNDPFMYYTRGNIGYLVLVFNCREKSYPRNSSCPLVIILDCIHNFFFVQSSFVKAFAHIRNLISALNTFFYHLRYKNFSLTSFVTLPVSFFSLCSNICMSLSCIFFSVRVSDA